MALGALVLLAAGAGVGMATTGPSPAPSTTAAPAGHTGNKHDRKAAAKPVDPAKAAWSHTYGQDRATMPALAPADSASPQQQAAARDLLTRTEAATAPYRDLAAAKAAGYDLAASLARREKLDPRLADRIKQIDAAGAPAGAKMPMLHVGNAALRGDGRVLDPSAPESLMYTYDKPGTWTLIGVMYVATESYPQAPPDPGGPITRWHYHDDAGARGLMMHVFFVPGNDLARAFALEMS